MHSDPNAEWRARRVDPDAIDLTTIGSSGLTVLAKPGVLDDSVVSLWLDSEHEFGLHVAIALTGEEADLLVEALQRLLGARGDA
jgi:hypothetical protein